jgi:hypothetical protein
LPEKIYRPGEAIGSWIVVTELERRHVTRYRVSREGFPFAELMLLPAMTALEERAGQVTGLHHENLLALFDMGREGDLTFVVRELVGGWSVADWLAREGRLGFDQALGVACQLCLASMEATKAGIGFLGFHSERVLVDNKGFAKADPLRLPVPREEDYLSPEELRGEEPGRGSDVFRIGLMIYKMLTGRLPERDGFARVRYEPLPETDRKPLAGLNDTLRRALAHDPAERIRDTEALLDELHPMLMGRPLSSAGGAAEHWYEDKRFWLYVAIALGATAIILGLLFGLPPFPKSN